MRTGKRKAGEGRRQVTDFEETVCCPSAIVQRAAWQKMVCARGVSGVMDPRKAISTNPNGVRGRTTTWRLLIGAEGIPSVSKVYQLVTHWLVLGDFWKFFLMTSGKSQHAVAAFSVLLIL